MSIQVTTDMIGKWTLIIDERIAIHLLPDRSEQYNLWGFEQSWYDGPIYSLGLGSLLLVTWTPAEN